MSTSLLPELGNVVIAGAFGASKSEQITLRQRCEILRGTLELERGTFLSHWKELGKYILPRRPRFSITDHNKGDRRNDAILDSTATEAAGTLSAGMMAGVTSPARPWFRLITGYPELDENKNVQEYLYEVQRRMATAFLRSNLYKVLPILYGDLGVFGTAAMGMFEDDEYVFRFYDQPIGLYAIANDKKNRIRTFVRTFEYTVQQTVEIWGDLDRTGRPDFLRGLPTRVSLNVQNLWNRGNRMAWIPICHVVQENLSYDGRKIEARFKRFQDIYYELSAPNAPLDDRTTGTLEEGGFEEFPMLVARWETNSEDVYATNCPGMKALGDIKQLQMGERRSAQGIEKMVNPPLTGPARLMNVKVSVLPGDLTYDDVREGQEGIRPIYQVDFSKGVEALENKQQQVRLRIKSVFKEDLFLMLSQSDRREITAREIDERHEEKLLALGPVLEQLNQDVLDPLIDRSFAIMERKGLLPDPPEELHGVTLRVEYISIMAQAQKQIGLIALERFSSFVAQIAQADPSILDNVDDQELIQQYADATGVPPKILRDPKAVQAIRDARQQAQQQQQQAENAPKLAGAANQLGQAEPTNNNVLGLLLAKARARQTIGATASPPPPVVQP